MLENDAVVEAVMMGDGIRKAGCMVNLAVLPMDIKGGRVPVWEAHFAIPSFEHCLAKLSVVKNSTTHCMKR